MSSEFRRAVYKQLRAVSQSVFGDSRVYALGASPSEGTPARYVTWSRVDGVHARHLTAGAGCVADRYDVNVWSRKLSDAEQLADRLREVLDNFGPGEIGDAEDQATVQGVFLDADGHSFEPPTDGSAEGWHRIRLEFVFWRAESVSPNP